jgi:hypothetical protein
MAKAYPRISKAKHERLVADLQRQVDELTDQRDALWAERHSPRFQADTEAAFKRGEVQGRRKAAAALYVMASELMA